MVNQTSAGDWVIFTQRSELNNVGEFWRDFLGIDPEEFRHFQLLSEAERDAVRSLLVLFDYYQKERILNPNTTKASAVRHFAEQIDAVWLLGGHGRAVDYRNAARVVQMRMEYEEWVEEKLKEIMAKQIKAIFPYRLPDRSVGFVRLDVCADSRTIMTNKARNISIGSWGVRVTEVGGMVSLKVNANSTNKADFAMNPFRFYPKQGPQLAQTPPVTFLRTWWKETEEKVGALWCIKPDRNEYHPCHFLSSVGSVGWGNEESERSRPFGEDWSEARMFWSAHIDTSTLLVLLSELATQLNKYPIRKGIQPVSFGIEKGDYPEGLTVSGGLHEQPEEE